MFFDPEQLFLIAKIALFRPFKRGGNTFIPSFLFDFIFLEAFWIFFVSMKPWYNTYRQKELSDVHQGHEKPMDGTPWAFLIVRRKGMSKPPVKLGVDESHLIEKERTS